MSQKRRTFSSEIRFEAVMELLRGHKPVTDICRERQINDNLLYKWRDALLKRGASVFEAAPGKASLDHSSAWIAELERMVGRLAVENDILKKPTACSGNCGGNAAHDQPSEYRLSGARVLGYARSSYYAAPQPRQPAVALVAAVERMLLCWPFYGYRRVLAQLRRDGQAFSERHVWHVFKQLGVTRQVGRVRTTDSSKAHTRYANRLRDLAVTALNQVWVADITYPRLERRFFYLAVILDAHSRAVRGWVLGLRLDEESSLRALKHALAERTPQLCHSDQGLNTPRKRMLPSWLR